MCFRHIKSFDNIYVCTWQDSVVYLCREKKTKTSVDENVQAQRALDCLLKYAYKALIRNKT